MNEPNKLNLVNLKDGSALIRWDEALEKVIENILDPNTVEKGKREINMKAVFIPMEGRAGVKIRVEITTKLCSPSPVTSVLYVGKVSGKFLAAEHDPSQFQLFTDEPVATFPAAVSESEQPE